MIVLDASVVIAFWGQQDHHHERAFEILDTEEGLCTHPITLAECFVGQARTGRVEEAVHDFELIGIERYQPTANEPEILALLRATTGLKLPDCCVLAAAEHVGGSLATFDRRLADVARTRGIDVLGDVPAEVPFAKVREPGDAGLPS